MIRGKRRRVGAGDAGDASSAELSTELTTTSGTEGGGVGGETVSAEEDAGAIDEQPLQNAGTTNPVTADTTDTAAGTASNVEEVVDVTDCSPFSSVPVCRNVFIHTVLTSPRHPDGTGFAFGRNGSHRLVRVRVLGVVRAVRLPSDPAPASTTPDGGAGSGSHATTVDPTAGAAPAASAAVGNARPMFAVDDGTGVLWAAHNRPPTAGTTVQLIGEVAENRVVNVIALSVLTDPMHGAAGFAPSSLPRRVTLSVLLLSCGGHATVSGSSHAVLNSAPHGSICPSLGRSHIRHAEAMRWHDVVALHTKFYNVPAGRAVAGGPPPRVSPYTAVGAGNGDDAANRWTPFNLARAIEVSEAEAAEVAAACADAFEPSQPSQESVSATHPDLSFGFAHGARTFRQPFMLSDGRIDSPITAGRDATVGRANRAVDLCKGRSRPRGAFAWV
jgi:hypothetical protein